MKAQLNMKQTTLLIVSLGFILFTSCSKEEEIAPEIQSGVTAKLTFEDGSTIDYKGTVIAAIWSQEDDYNILSIVALDKEYKDAVLSFGISYADGAGDYSLAPTDIMATPSTLVWPNMEFDNWPGFVTGDADGDGVSDGNGTFKITTLTETETKGTFSMVMGNDMGEKVTVKGQFNCPVRRITGE